MGGWTLEIKGMSDWGFGKEKGMFIWRRRRRHVWVGVALVLVIAEIEGGREERWIRWGEETDEEEIGILSM